MADPTNDNPNPDPNVLAFGSEPDLNSLAADSLLFALHENLREVVVLGRYPDGRIFIDHTFTNPADANFLIDQAKHDLLFE